MSKDPEEKSPITETDMVSLSSILRGSQFLITFAFVAVLTGMAAVVAHGVDRFLEKSK